MSSPSPVSFTVTHRGSAHPLSLLPTETLALLHARLEELTNVPAAHQKLLYKRKPAKTHDGTSLDAAGIKDGWKVQLIGPTRDELGGIDKEEEERKRVERVMQERASKPQFKVRSTGSPSVSTLDSSSSTSQYRFHRLEPLAHLPHPSEALALLTRLSTDPAVQHLMHAHKFSVGLLTELAPHEQPHLLGLNENAGQAIKLRLRTNAYDGFRIYSEVRRVLCHELTHNVWSDHDNNFKELNSQLNREIAEFEARRAAGTHSLSSYDGEVYEASSELEAEAHAHVLGGAGGGGVSREESAEDRRRRVLAATMGRLRKEEEQLEGACGTAGPASNADA